MRHGKGGPVGEPHGEIAVVAPAGLAVKGGIAGGSRGVCHDGSEELRRFPAASLRGRTGTWTHEVFRHNTGGLPTRQRPYRATGGWLSR